MSIVQRRAITKQQIKGIWTPFWNNLQMKDTVFLQKQQKQYIKCYVVIFTTQPYFIGLL